jgi:hypothetical protein
MTVVEAALKAAMELERATALHGPFASPHEAYAVLKEEVDELWDDIKANRIEEARLEAIQVAAMALRFLVESAKWMKFR